MRLIDFGAEFCSLRGESSDGLRTWDQLTSIAVEEGCCGDDDVSDATTRLAELLMLVILSAVLRGELYHGRERLKTRDEAQRAELNVMHDIVGERARTESAAMIRSVKRALRLDDVRGVLRHYNGSRDAGTRRVLAAANLRL